MPHIQTRETKALMENTVLCQIRKRQLCAYRSINPSDYEIKGNEGAATASKDRLSVSKTILKGAHIADIQSQFRRVDAALKKYALPSPWERVSIIPIASLEALDNELDDIGREIARLADNLATTQAYTVMKAEAREALGPFWKAEQFPAREKVRDGFGFERNYFRMTVPEDDLAAVKPEIAERERDNLVNAFNEAAELAKASLASGLRDLTNHLVDRLGYGDDGQPRIFKKNSFDNLRQFFDFFDARNVTGWEEINVMVERLKGLVSNQDVTALRTNLEQRDALRTQFQLAGSMLERWIDDSEARGIVLDE